MKYVFIFVICTSPLLAFASIQTDACSEMENIRKKLNIISSNIANLSTTRTPDGGPYSRKEFVCSEKKCEVKEYYKIVTKYKPDHPDADENGYVSYPDIDIKQEMESMIQATRDYEVAANTCK